MKTIVTLSAALSVAPGINVPFDAAVLRDDNLSWDGSGFVAKESGDFRVTAFQQISPFDGDGKAQLAVYNGEDPTLISVIGNTGYLSGSRIVSLKAGEKLVPNFLITGENGFTASAGEVESQIVFENA